ncbi:MAG: 4-(cytidine 5'-diphospho)-2-C-methyl-D-erythritol kinase [Candidatus Omnitrophota bacterium]
MEQLNPPLIIKSFAKLNLYLRVLNKRKDNFHNLSSLFCRIDLADTIILKKLKDDLIQIKCDNRHLPIDATNLCWRAANLLKQEFGLNYGVEIRIRKRIPIGAGLGGGSSDAASVLLGLNKYWNLNLSRTKLAGLGAKLGSDVAFFIYDTKFAQASSRGDKIKPVVSLEELKLWFIVVYPNIKVSTPLIYQKFDTSNMLSINPEQASSFKPRRVERVGHFSQLTRPRCNVKILTSELLKNGKGIDASCFFNNLEVITNSLYPVVNQVKNALSNIGLEKIMMSGSGSAVFALCNSGKQAKDLSSKLARKYKAWQIFATSTV